MRFKQVVRAKNRRAGRFSLASWSIDNSDVAVSRIMSQCIIVRAEMDYMRGTIDYQAISWRFRETIEGEILPLYVWHYNDETGQLTVTEVSE
jgi:hypothetical protein